MLAIRYLGQIECLPLFGDEQTQWFEPDAHIAKTRQKFSYCTVYRVERSLFFSVPILTSGNTFLPHMGAAHEVTEIDLTMDQRAVVRRPLILRKCSRRERLVCQSGCAHLRA